MIAKTTIPLLERDGFTAVVTQSADDYPSVTITLDGEFDEKESDAIFMALDGVIKKIQEMTKNTGSKAKS